jgi:hypothetical protein
VPQAEVRRDLEPAYLRELLKLEEQAILDSLKARAERHKRPVATAGAAGGAGAAAAAEESTDAEWQRLMAAAPWVQQEGPGGGA